MSRPRIAFFVAAAGIAVAAVAVQFTSAAPVAVEQGDTVTLNCPNGVPAGLDSNCGVVNVKKPTTTVATTTTLPAPTTTQAATTTAAATTTTRAPTTTAAPTTTVAPPAGVQFSEDFSSPSAVDRFVFQRMHGVVNPAESTQHVTWHGDHDMACGDPNLTNRGPLHFEPSTEPMLPFAAMNGHAYYCQPGNDPAKGHLMTASNSDAYNHIDFMPNQIFSNVRKVCFDVNWTELGGRKWVQMAVVPESYFQAKGRQMSYALPFLEGDGNVAARAQFVRDGVFLFSAFRSEIRTNTGTSSGAITQETYGNGFNDGQRYYDKAPRFTQCIEDVGGGNVRISRPNFPAALGGPETRTQRGAFPTGPVRVIFMDVEYDGIKGDDANEGRVTWHWDRIVIE